jgi:hypothetical protein
LTLNSGKLDLVSVRLDQKTQSLENFMKKTLLVAAAIFAMGALAEPVHDWHDLDAVHKHVLEAVHEIGEARAKNHYDMNGHGAKAEQLLIQAERELDLAVQSAKAAK